MRVLAAPESGAAGAAARDDGMRTSWLRGVSLGVGVQGAGLALSFATGAVAARLLGPAGLGVYAYALAAAGAASVPAALGLPAAVTRFLAVYRQREEWSAARGLLRYADRLAVGVGLLLGAGVAALGFFGWSGQRLPVFLLAAPLVPLFAAANLRQKALQGLDRPVAAQLPLQVIKPAVFLLAAGALWLAGVRAVRTPEGAMAAWTVSVAIAFGAGASLVRSSSPRSLCAAPPDVSRKGVWLRVALPMLLADSMGMLYTRTDTLMLGALRPATDVGLYAVALRAAAILAVLLGASNWVLAPWFARLHDEGNRERLQRIVTRSTRAVFAVTFLGFCVAVIWGKLLLGTVFGAPFRAAYPALVVLGVARLVDVAVGPVVTLLAMTGGQRALAVTMGCAALANVVGCGLLIPRFGMMGAAFSFGAAVVATNVALAAVVRRRLGVGSTIIGA